MDPPEPEDDGDGHSSHDKQKRKPPRRTANQSEVYKPLLGLWTHSAYLIQITLAAARPSLGHTGTDGDVGGSPLLVSNDSRLLSSRDSQDHSIRTRDIKPLLPPPPSILEADLEISTRADDLPCQPFSNHKEEEEEKNRFRTTPVATFVRAHISPEANSSPPRTQHIIPNRPKLGRCWLLW
ncbi:hypothetical protein CGRA01v4_02387 [Colletotrichum graminicola]|nr:hypothetical protein CGRA01v4_02387 [Colletotrichum graminicola]